MTPATQPASPFGPLPPVQPDTQEYSFTDLNLFLDLSIDPPVAPIPWPQLIGAAAQQAANIRAAYKALTGVDAPDWNAALPAKYWEDPAQAGMPGPNVVDYSIANPGLGTFSTLQILCSSAAAVNIPGLRVRPPYVIAPTLALNMTAGNPGAPINALYLSSLADATALAAEWGLPAAAVVDASPAEITWNLETRRFYDVVWNGVAQSAGVAIAQQNANGLNPDGTWSSAGSWSFLGTGPSWDASPLPVDGISAGVAAGPAVAVPVRALLANEKIIMSNLAWVIERTDLVAPSTTGGGMTQLQADQLAFCVKALGLAVPAALPAPTS